MKFLQTPLLLLCLTLFVLGCMDATKGNFRGNATNTEEVQQGDENDISEVQPEDDTTTGEDSTTEIEAEDTNEIMESDTNTTTPPDAYQDTYQDTYNQETSEPDVAEDTHPEEVESNCGDLDEPCCYGVCNGDLVCGGDAYCSEGMIIPCDNPDCFVPEPGSPDAEIAVMTGTPPSLGGGDISDFNYELISVKIYPDNTFLPSLITSMEITSQGNTYGSLIFEDDEWAFSANLDLYMNIVTFMEAFEQAFEQNLYAGGCYLTEGNQIATDLTVCGSGWPDGVNAPDSFDFETYGSNIMLIISFSKQSIINVLPPDLQALGDILIQDDLPMLLTFSQN